MTEIDRELVDKYFKNSCSKEEAVEVLNWFKTEEGKKFLSEKLETDSNWVNDKQVKVLVQDIDSDRIFDRINRRIDQESDTDSRRSGLGNIAPRLMQAAAVLLVLMVSAWFTSTVMESTNEEEESRYQVTDHLYETGPNEIRDLILSDGTLVRLNEGSSISISPAFNGKSRKVHLEGEAYFDVERMESKPFIVKTQGAEVEVLGTAFNVNSHLSANDEVQLSVVEGLVRFRTSSGSNAEQYQSILVEEGQFGVLKTESNQLILEDKDPVNYLHWMSRRIEYRDDTLEYACTQMRRIYGYECRYESDELMSERFTSTFSESGVEKFISVISLTLDINPKINRDEKYVEWSYN